MLDPRLNHGLVRARRAELWQARRSAMLPRPPSAPRLTPDAVVTLRYGFPDDAVALARLAALDSTRVPDGPLLLAEVSGEIRAALSLTDGTAIADPFHPTVELISLLRARADQLRGGAAGSRGLRRGVWARLRLRVGAAR